MSGAIQRSVVVLLLAIISVSCGGGGNANTGSAYTISGTVSSSGTGLQGVVVTLHSGGTTTFTTDASGKFTFRNVTNGTYSITPARPGYTFSPSTSTAQVNGANVDGQDFIVTANASLACSSLHGGGTYGVQFYYYSGIIALDSTAAANEAGTSSLQWQVQYQNMSVPAGDYTGSLRARLWAVPYSVSSGVFETANLIGEFYPNFTGSGAYSSNQLYVGSASDVQITSSAGQNPPAGEYCIVATLEEYIGDTTYCPSPDHYCEVDWWQSGNSWIFY